MTVKGKTTEQFVGSNAPEHYITSITPLLPLSSFQNRVLPETGGRRRSRADRSTTLPVMRRIYASGVRATDTYSFPFLDVDPGWQSRWQPAARLSLSSTCIGSAGSSGSIYVRLDARCRKRYRTEFRHNVDVRRAPATFFSLGRISLTVSTR